jgi:hypothetical protein
MHADLTQMVELVAVVVESMLFHGSTSKENAMASHIKRFLSNARIGSIFGTEFIAE